MAWYVFSADNSSALYGFTDDHSIADAYCDALNYNRATSLYSATELSDAEVAALNPNVLTHPVFTQDSKIEDVSAIVIIRRPRDDVMARLTDCYGRHARQWEVYLCAALADIVIPDSGGPAGPAALKMWLADAGVTLDDIDEAMGDRDWRGAALCSLGSK